jgi:hypothetical protein
MFGSINAIEFNRKFTSNDDCRRYLAKIKWGKGFHCVRCGCRSSVKGRTQFHRRCADKSCRYDESVTANSIYHDIKMPLLKAFHMIFRLSAKKKAMSSPELAVEVGVQQKTAWKFMHKVQQAMSQQDAEKLDRSVEVDETLFGFHTDRAHCGRNLQERQAVMVAVEILEDGRAGNMRMIRIDNFKADTLQDGIMQMVNPEVSITTDDFSSYHTLKNRGLPIKTTKKNEKNALKQMHRQIMMFKHWLKGIHHKWSRQYLQAYIDGYIFRFNRRNCRQLIFHSAVTQMMNKPPFPYAEMKRQCALNT